MVVASLVREEWINLLAHLKSTVEGLLANQCVNVWNTYGGLDRLCAGIENIMKHQIKVCEPLIICLQCIRTFQ